MAPHSHGWRVRLRALRESAAPGAERFRYALLLLDVVSLLWIIVASFLPLDPWVLAVDAALGVLLLLDWLSRQVVHARPWRAALHPAELLDLAAILSLLLAPLLSGGLAFLRVLRLLRLLAMPRVLTALRDDLPGFRLHEEAALAAFQLGVFIFVMTGLVFETQHGHNEQIRNYGDALYFTVTALTTTGFGDIVPRDTAGRLVTVVIMLAGVTLFLRLAQALFRPLKVLFPCPACGLQRHEPDAVHCKACGTLLNIPDEGS